MLGGAGRSNGEARRDVAEDLHSDGMLWLGEATVSDAEQSRGKAQLSNAVATEREALEGQRRAKPGESNTWKSNGKASDW